MWISVSSDWLWGTSKKASGNNGKHGSDHYCRRRWHSPRGTAGTWFVEDHGWAEGKKIESVQCRSMITTVPRDLSSLVSVFSVNVKIIWGQNTLLLGISLKEVMGVGAKRVCDITVVKNFILEWATLEGRGSNVSFLFNVVVKIWFSKFLPFYILPKWNAYFAKWESDNLKITWEW